MVMYKRISPYQSAFLKGILLVYGFMTINELRNLAKRYKNDFLIYKVDFKKDYDFVSWSLLD